jgi:hypothetical protein
MTRFKKSIIYEKLNTKHEEEFVKKLAWKKATSSWKSRKQHPDDIMEAESRAKKFFRNFISLRKKERAIREKARLKGSPKRGKKDMVKSVKVSFKTSALSKKRFTKNSIYENLNTKNEDTLVKKLAWKKATSSIRGAEHPYEVELRANKFFKQFIRLRKKERALREKARLKGSPKRAKGSPKRAKGLPKRAK